LSTSSDFQGAHRADISRKETTDGAALPLIRESKSARIVPRARRPARAARITAVIPAMNEAENLPHVLARLPANIHELILVDGHSADDTVAVARRLRPDVRVLTQTHQGKGNALACGFAMATGDIIVMLDADGSTDPGEIPLFISALLDGADFAKGSRYIPGGASEDLTRVRRMGNRFLTGTVNVLFGVDHTDLCYGYMAFWRRCLPQLTLDCTGFEVETLLVLRAVRAALNVVEVPSLERSRLSGAGNLRPVRDGLRIMRTILRERLRRDRTALYAPVWAALTGGLAEITTDGGSVSARARLTRPTSDTARRD